MKKIIIATVITIMMICLTACKMSTSGNIWGHDKWHNDETNKDYLIFTSAGGGIFVIEE